MNKIPVLFSSKEECCGCGACGDICPVGAIGMIKDNMGFFYPSINEDICLRCGQCVGVCTFK